jgi:hypothetical protein
MLYLSAALNEWFRLKDKSRKMFGIKPNLCFFLKNFDLGDLQPDSHPSLTLLGASFYQVRLVTW